MTAKAPKADMVIPRAAAARVAEPPVRLPAQVDGSPPVIGRRCRPANRLGESQVGAAGTLSRGPNITSLIAADTPRVYDSAAASEQSGAVCIEDTNCPISDLIRASARRTYRCSSAESARDAWSDAGARHHLPL
jgi:hypothetical protein